MGGGDLQRLMQQQQGLAGLYQASTCSNSQSQNPAAWATSIGGYSTSERNVPGGIIRTTERGVPMLATKQTPEKKGMFTEIAKDVKSFILEYRGVLYFLAAALIIDHLIFKGAFRVRLQSMADKVVAKVEAKIAA